MDKWSWLCHSRGLRRSEDNSPEVDQNPEESPSHGLIKRGKKALRGVDVALRVYDMFGRTFEGLRAPLEAITGKLRAQDEEITYGMGVIEDKSQAHGIAMGASTRGVFGVSDILYNPHKKEYLAVTRSGKIYRWDWALNSLPELHAPKMRRFTRFLWVNLPTSGFYICWNPGKSVFHLAKEDLMTPIDVNALAPIDRIFYPEPDIPYKKEEPTVVFLVICGSSLNKYMYSPISNSVGLTERIRLSDLEVEGSKVEHICSDQGTEDRRQWIYLTHLNGCSVVDISGRNLGTKKNLHTSRITSICSAAEFIVTGDERGIVKLWAGHWHLQAEVKAFESPVTHIMAHPNGNACVAFSRDQSLVALGLRSHKLLETLRTPELIERICINEERASFLTQGPRKLQLWKMDALYQLLISLNARIETGYSSHWDTRYPQRIIITDSENALRTICPSTGAILSTALVNPVTPKMLSSAYSPSSNMAFCITGALDNPEEDQEGSKEQPGIKIWDMGQNPGVLTRNFLSKFLYDASYTALAFFEYIHEVILNEVPTFHRSSSMKSVKFREFSGQASFLIGGREDGSICRIDLASGESDFQVKCHNGPVTSISVSPELCQFVSIGSDPCVRLWKIELTHEELFMPLLDISWSWPIGLVALAKENLAFVLSHPSATSHKLVIFNMLNQERFDHSSRLGHSKEIISLSSSQDILLFCTASLDETLRLWNEKCELIRILALNTTPSFVFFGTRQGDLMMAAGNGLYVIPANKHLTTLYRNRVKLNHLSPGEVESPVELSVAKSGGDPRLEPNLEQTSGTFRVPPVQFYEEPKDSFRAKELDKMRFLENDLQRIVNGDHPLSSDVPDLTKMNLDQLQEFGQKIFPPKGDENRRYFVSEGRLTALYSLKDQIPELDSYQAINP